MAEIVDNPQMKKQKQESSFLDKKQESSMKPWYKSMKKKIYMKLFKTCYNDSNIIINKNK